MIWSTACLAPSTRDRCSVSAAACGRSSSRPGYLASSAQIGRHRAGDGAGLGIDEEVGIDGGVAHLAGGHGGIEGRHIDAFAAIIVDDDGAVVHRRQDGGIHHIGVGIFAGGGVQRPQARCALK